MHESKNIPELRFPEFSGEWVEKRLEEILELSKDRINPKMTTKNIKCIELEHISQNTGKLIGYTLLNKQNSIKNLFKKTNSFWEIKAIFEKVLVYNF